MTERSFWAVGGGETYARLEVPAEGWLRAEASNGTPESGELAKGWFPGWSRGEFPLKSGVVQKKLKKT